MHNSGIWQETHRQYAIKLTFDPMHPTITSLQHNVVYKGLHPTSSQVITFLILILIFILAIGRTPSFHCLQVWLWFYSLRSHWYLIHSKTIDKPDGGRGCQQRLVWAFYGWLSPCGHLLELPLSLFNLLYTAWSYAVGNKQNKEVLFVTICLVIGSHNQTSDQCRYEVFLRCLLWPHDHSGQL